ncbi:hypothetical protein JTB14_001420 [Gonioctena quinquepunctata]|nr:hypothetical protein JTB14_001420 [Gonioctena quinquepunctata]
MSGVVRDVGKVWDRLFDHKGFLSGEIAFMLREFEQKREDKEVDTLFRVIENLTEIKDTGVDRLQQIEERVEKVNEDLRRALSVCSEFSDLENRIKQDTTIEDKRLERKIIWEEFMDGITSTYSEINSNSEAKEEELTKLFEDIEKKLLI